MTQIAPNIPDWFKKNPPEILNCKHCGAEAYVHGIPNFEWWTYEICCSKYCKSSKRFQIYDLQELVKEWNKVNEF